MSLETALGNVRPGRHLDVLTKRKPTPAGYYRGRRRQWADAGLCSSCGKVDVRPSRWKTCAGCRAGAARRMAAMQGRRS